MNNWSIKEDECFNCYHKENVNLLNNNNCYICNLPKSGVQPVVECYKCHV